MPLLEQPNERRVLMGISDAAQSAWAPWKETTGVSTRYPCRADLVKWAASRRAAFKRIRDAHILLEKFSLSTLTTLPIPPQSSLSNCLCYFFFLWPLHLPSFSPQLSSQWPPKSHLPSRSVASYLSTRRLLYASTKLTSFSFAGCFRH